MECNSFAESMMCENNVRSQPIIYWCKYFVLKLYNVVSIFYTNAVVVFIFSASINFNKLSCEYVKLL